MPYRDCQVSLKQTGFQILDAHLGVQGSWAPGLLGPAQPGVPLFHVVDLSTSSACRGLPVQPEPDRAPRSWRRSWACRATGRCAARECKQLFLKNWLRLHFEVAVQRFGEAHVPFS